VNEQPQDDCVTAKPHDREVGYSRHVIHNAKLVTTFSAAIAATFVATTLQTDPLSNWDKAAVALMGATLVVTFCVIALRPKHHDAEISASDLQHAKRRTHRAHWLMVAQLVLSSASCVVAAIGLLSQDL
jgi:hypothetical protein